MKTKTMDKDRVKMLFGDLKSAIRDCKNEIRDEDLSLHDHRRIDLEGKIYAYEFVRDILLQD